MSKLSQEKLDKKTNELISTSVSEGFAEAIYRQDTDFEVIENTLLKYSDIIDISITKLWAGTGGEKRENNYCYLLKDILKHKNSLELLQLLEKEKPTELKKIINKKIDDLGYTVMHMLLDEAVCNVRTKVSCDRYNQILDIFLNNGGDIKKESNCGEIPFWGLIESCVNAIHFFPKYVEYRMEILNRVLFKDTEIVNYKNKKGQNFFGHLTTGHLDEETLLSLELMLTLNVNPFQKTKNTFNVEKTVKEICDDFKNNLHDYYEQFDKIYELIEQAEFKYKEQTLYLQASKIETNWGI